MQIIERKVADLVPYEKNPRINDYAVDKVAASIKEFGFKQPIVVDADGVVIVGHTRLKAAKMLGLEVVPVIVAEDLTTEQANAYRLADNKTNEFASWDYDLLDAELFDIGQIDMEQFGFDMNAFTNGIGGGIDAHEDADVDKITGEEIECPSCGFVFEV